MSSAAGVRLFVALELPEPVRQALHLWARAALAATSESERSPGRVEAAAEFAARRRGERRVRSAVPRSRLLAVDSQHLTMVFLGQRPPSELPALCSIVEAVALPSAVEAQLGVGAPLWLPPRQPRALAVEIRDDLGWLRELHRALLRELQTAIGAARQGAEGGRGGARGGGSGHFRPHVTVARLGGGAGLVRADLPPTPALKFPPDRLALFRSELLPEGARYQRIAAGGPPD